MLKVNKTMSTAALCRSEFENLTVMEPKPRRKKGFISFTGVWCMCIMNIDISIYFFLCQPCISLNLLVSPILIWIPVLSQIRGILDIIDALSFFVTLFSLLHRNKQPLTFTPNLHVFGLWEETWRKLTQA